MCTSTQQVATAACTGNEGFAFNPALFKQISKMGPSLDVVFLFDWKLFKEAGSY